MRNILFLVVLAACSKEGPQIAPPPAMPVTVAAVEVRDVPLYFEEMGVIVPAQSAEIKPLVQGKIEAVHFVQGDWVEEGDLLYTLDDAPYAIRVQEAEAQLAQNEAGLANAQKKWERYKSLSKPELIAEVEWDELQTRLELATAMVKGDLARLAAARLDFDRCRIAAPISGRAGQSALGVGNFAFSHETLVTLSQDRQLFVDFAVTETERGLLQEGPFFIEIFPPGSDERTASGEVIFVDHALNPKTGMAPVRAAIAETEKPLFLGQAVRVHLHYGTIPGARLVPLRAIKTSQWGPYLYSVHEDQTVEMRQVALGPEEGGMVVVRAGLDGVANVVTEGQLRLFPGSKIEVAP